MSHTDLANVWEKPQSFRGLDHYGLRLNNLTTAQRDALTGSGAPFAGAAIFNTTTGQPEFYDGSNWVSHFAVDNVSVAGEITVDGATGTGADTAGVLRLETSETTVVTGDQLGRIDFRAPAETGADAILVSASFWAEAKATFDATTNTTDFVWALGTSEVAAEKMRLTPSAVLTLATGGSFVGPSRPPAGTTTVAPSLFTAGTNLTTAAAGAAEFDGVQHYLTIEASNRAALPAEQYFQLAADGGNISTIANFFGATSNITLVSGAVYEIEIVAWFLNSTTGTVTWTLTNSQAPTNQNIYFEMSPITGIVAPPGTATMLVGQYMNDATAARAFTSGSLTDAVNHYARFRILLHNATGVSLLIQATKGVGGTITPQRGSYWRCRRLSTGNVGTFVA